MIYIDYQDSRPIYEQIVEKFQSLMIQGVLEPDSQLPSVRQLASDLAINPNTIQKAFAILEAEGYIYTVRGRGNFVSGDSSAHDRKREDWKKKLEACLADGKELGVPAEEARQCVDRVYQKAALGQKESSAQ